MTTPAWCNTPRHLESEVGGVLVGAKLTIGVRARAIIVISFTYLPRAKKSFDLLPDSALKDPADEGVKTFSLSKWQKILLNPTQEVHFRTTTHLTTKHTLTNYPKLTVSWAVENTTRLCSS